MGWEVELNAFPADCNLLAAVTRGEIDAELLTFVRTYFRMRRKLGCRVNSFAERDPECQVFVDALETIVADHPGIDHRFCDLERRFEWLKWLLQESSHAQDATLAATAIGGEAQVTPSARSIQGFPIRWTSPGTCELIHMWLTDLAQKDLRSHYDPDRMRNANLYKWGPPTDTELAFEWIMDDFTSLKSFYCDVAKNSEAVLVVAD
ncbi:MAG: DUF1877 family protein [Pirellulaceae bacterium]